MRTAKRAILRLALIGWLGLVGLSGLPAQPGSGRGTPGAGPPRHDRLPAQAERRQSVSRGVPQQPVRPALERPGPQGLPRRARLSKLEDATKTLKEKIGVSLKELFELPQGTLAIAAISPRRSQAPRRAGVIIADAGENEKKMLEVLSRATKQAEEAGAKVSTEIVQRPDAPHHPVPAARAAKENDKEKDAKPTRPDPPLVWTNAGSLFFIGSDVERHQGPGRPSRRPRQLAGRDRGLHQDPGQDRLGQGPGRSGSSTSPSSSSS